MSGKPTPDDAGLAAYTPHEHEELLKLVVRRQRAATQLGGAVGVIAPHTAASAVRPG